MLQMCWLGLFTYVLVVQNGSHNILWTKVTKVVIKLQIKQHDAGFYRSITDGCNTLRSTLKNRLLIHRTPKKSFECLDSCLLYNITRGGSDWPLNNSAVWHQLQTHSKTSTTINNNCLQWQVMQQMVCPPTEPQSKDHEVSLGFTWRGRITNSIDTQMNSSKFTDVWKNKPTNYLHKLCDIENFCYFQDKRC